jgi:hypothetical protein
MDRETSVVDSSLIHEQIEHRAYELWEERGHPWGTPEIDWFQAEHEVQGKEESTITSFAREVGTVIGTAVAFVAKPNRCRHPYDADN